jgi:hypothetical protein
MRTCVHAHAHACAHHNYTCIYSYLYLNDISLPSLSYSLALLPPPHPHSAAEGNRQMMSTLRLRGGHEVSYIYTHTQVSFSYRHPPARWLPTHLPLTRALHRLILSCHAHLRTMIPPPPLPSLPLSHTLPHHQAHSVAFLSRAVRTIPAVKILRNVYVI